MAIVQAICLIAINTKLNKLKNEEKPKILKNNGMVYSCCISVILCYYGRSTTRKHSICWKKYMFNIRILLMIIGNYIPKMSYEMSKTTFHPMPKSEKSFRKMSKIMGYRNHILLLIGIVLLR